MRYRTYRSRNRASTSSCDLNSPQRHKSTTNKENSSKLSDFDEQNDKSYLSGVESLLDTPSSSNTSKQRTEEDNESFDSQKENYDKSNSDDEDADTERLKLIQDLINQQKKKIIFTTCKDDEDFSDSTSELISKREQMKQNSLAKIMELRKLPDYEKIDKFLNTPPETYYQKSLQASLNTLPREESKTVRYWNTNSFLCRKIEQCVLNRKWSYLTKLLIILADSSKSYKPYLLKGTLLNLLCNSAAQKDKSLVENFLKTCFSCRTEEDVGKVFADLFHIKKEKDTNDEDTADEGL